MEIFFHHGIPQLMNFNRLLKFGFIFESNTPQKHIKERLLQLAVHQLTNLDGTSSQLIMFEFCGQILGLCSRGEGRCRYGR